MSRKYFDKLMIGSGSTTKTVKSKFGEKMMAQMGWTAGNGLGKKEDGMKECIQIKRREEGTGLGQEASTPSTAFKWNDTFWTDIYNKNISKFGDIKGEGVKVTADSSSSDSSDEEESNNSKKETGPSSESEDSDGFVIEIKRSKKRLLKDPKSKKIKKDKKKKSKK